MRNYLDAVKYRVWKSTPRGVYIIPESDLYHLIMRSNMPDAERFQDWVVETVLPRIHMSTVLLIYSTNLLCAVYS